MNKAINPSPWDQFFENSSENMSWSFDIEKHWLSFDKSIAWGKATHNQWINVAVF